jgi:hypothetical protein
MCRPGPAAARRASPLAPSQNNLPPAPQDDITVDATRRCAVAEWHATAAHLLPGRAGGAPTGLVSEICGLDEIKFGADGRISSILSFRDRFAEEEEEAAAAAGAAAAAARRDGGGDGTRPAPPALE